ncbi:putative acetyltransferase [Saccharolobus solfataricus rod-shaped virus 1]|uniref:Putative acetyltransferase n=1 Tax=Saccharolobus solfataricus rod-shaped virus 1 TaxID=2730619 RepID=A0A6M3VWF4_SSRV1|nr:putative acetyltransferase [Saccharolobus solfataricus rod-shaped virus 1]QJF12294.1 putative acetyltransferase [Saccharolobus solfataricus rod-shaped virus 1]
MPEECKVIELEDKKDIELARLLIAKYHAQGIPHGGGASKIQKYFAYECDNFIVAIVWINDSIPFRFVAEKYKIPIDRSYFIRRVTKTAPGDYLVEFLEKLADLLKSYGIEVLWTLGFPNHSNALYKNAGFEYVGNTPRTNTPVFVKYLNASEKDKKTKNEVKKDE